VCVDRFARMNCVDAGFVAYVGIHGEYMALNRAYVYCVCRTHQHMNENKNKWHVNIYSPKACAYQDFCVLFQVFVNVCVSLHVFIFNAYMI
jgi:hypothetical protein